MLKKSNKTFTETFAAINIKVNFILVNRPKS